MERFGYEYGARPLHLLAVLATLGIAGYALLRIFENPSTGAVLLWLGAAVVAHDFIALPAYSLLMRIAGETGAGLASFGAPQHARIVAAHLLVPAGAALILLLVSFGLVFELGADRYEVSTGLQPDPYLGRWLGITGALFGISGIALAVRIRSARIGRPLEGAVPKDRVGGGWRLAGRLVLALGIVLVGWVFAAVVVGLANNPPF